MKIMFLIVVCIFALAFMIIPNTFAIEESTENKIQLGLRLPAYMLNQELHIKGEFFHNDPPKPIHTYRFPFNNTNATLLEITGEQREGISVTVEGTNGLLEIKIPKNFPLSNIPTDTGGAIIVLSNDIEILPKLAVTDCFYEYSFSIENFTTIEMIPTYYPETIPFVAQDVPDYCLEKTIAEYDYSYASPLKQFKAGIPFDEIECKNGLELVAKIPSAHPACVKPESLEKLTMRGWATTNKTVELTNPTKYVIEKNDIQFEIQYSLNGATLESIVHDIDANSIHVTLNNSVGGQMIISIPHGLLDEQIGESSIDDAFFLLIDGEENLYGDKTTETERTITIWFPNGAHDIEIIRTSWM